MIHDKDISKFVYVDSNSEPLYGSDQAYIAYPVRFPTVNIQILDTQGLCDLADALREQRGLLPLTPTEAHPNDYDPDAWYNFYINLNGFSSTHVDNCITAYTVTDDGEQEEYIEIDEEEQRLIYAVLDEQCKIAYGMGCEQLLEEARKEMMEVYTA